MADVVVDDVDVALEPPPSDEARSTSDSFYLVSQVKVHFATRNGDLCGHAHFDRVPDYASLWAAAHSLQRLPYKRFALYCDKELLSNSNCRSVLSMGLAEDSAARPAEREDLIVTVARGQPVTWVWVGAPLLLFTLMMVVCQNFAQRRTIQTLRQQLSEKEPAMQHAGPSLQQQPQASQQVLAERTAATTACQSALASQKHVSEDASVTSEPGLLAPLMKQLGDRDAIILQCKEELAGTKAVLGERAARIADLKDMLPQQHDGARGLGAPEPHHHPTRNVPAEQCQAGEDAAALVDCRHRVKQLEGLLSTGHKAPPTVDAAGKNPLLPRMKDDRVTLRGTALDEDGGYIIKAEWARGADLGAVHFSAEVSVTVFSEHDAVFSFKCSDGFKKMCKGIKELTVLRE